MKSTLERTNDFYSLIPSQAVFLLEIWHTDFLRYDPVDMLLIRPGMRRECGDRHASDFRVKVVDLSRENGLHSQSEAQGCNVMCVGWLNYCVDHPTTIYNLPPSPSAPTP